LKQFSAERVKMSLLSARSNERDLYGIDFRPAQRAT
jgi:hypothetical protein